MSDTVLAGLRVVEIGESTSAAVAGMVLADFGADVLLVEPPAGTRLRTAPAFPMWSRGKRSVRLDLSTNVGQDEVHELAADADVMITALAPRTADELGVDGASMTARHLQLVHCEITGFGRGHPLSDVPGYEGVVAAAAGRAHELGVLFDGARPAFPAVPVATHGAAMLALEGTFAALLEREQTGRGQRIETSLLRALSVFDLGSWAPGADHALRPFDAPMLIYTVARTRDGVWLQFSQNGAALFRAFLRALGLEHLLDDPRFCSAPNIADPDDARALRRILLDRVGERTWDEWQAVFASEPDVSAEPFAWPGDALRHPQLLHTGDSIEVDDAVLGRTRQLGPLVTMMPRPTQPQTPAIGTPPCLLQGVTVLELSTWIATPMATALLTELGARVVKIEPLDGDPMRRYGPMGLKCVQGKESIALDLKTDEGRGIVHRLAAACGRVRAQLPAGSSRAARHRRRDAPRAQPEADLPLRRVLRLDRADVGTPRVPRHRGGRVWRRVRAVGRRRRAGTRGRTQRRGARVVVATAHPVQRSESRLQRRARGGGRGDDGVVRAGENW